MDDEQSALDFFIGTISTDDNLSPEDVEVFFQEIHFLLSQEKKKSMMGFGEIYMELFVNEVSIHVDNLFVLIYSKFPDLPKILNFALGSRILGRPSNLNRFEPILVSSTTLLTTERAFAIYLQNALIHFKNNVCLFPMFSSSLVDRYDVSRLGLLRSTTSQNCKGPLLSVHFTQKARGPLLKTGF